MDIRYSKESVIRNTDSLKKLTFEMIDVSVSMQTLVTIPMMAELRSRDDECSRYY